MLQFGRISNEYFLNKFKIDRNIKKSISTHKLLCKLKILKKKLYEFEFMEKQFKFQLYLAVL